MGLEEKIIDGVLHYRWYSDAEFKPYTTKELTALLIESRNEHQKTQN